MSYKVQLSNRADKYLEKAGKAVRKRVDDALRDMVRYYESASEKVPDLNIMHGKYRGCLRLRIGNLRVILRMEKDRLIIFVIEIGPRGDVYK
jgi:mRNA interferase RelE/StbE